jgi:hypothetical protein
MPKFRKRPIVIEAVQFTQEMAISNQEIPDGVICNVTEYANGHENGVTHYGYVVRTLEGDMFVKVGDWIITGIKGEKYSCDGDIFEKTYELMK